MRTIAELHALARRGIRNGELPCNELPGVWAGPGADKSCSLCVAVVHAGDIAYEVEVKADQCPAGAKVLYFHIPCHNAWLFVCNEEPLSSTG